MDGVYLLNSPFTFQSMEKHAAYCAMMRLGLKVPETVLVPYKNPLDNSRYAYTAARYNQSFDLDAIAAKIGYPLFMKPYDGGAWRGVSRINNADELHAAYDASGEMLMHLQKAIDYDVFARSLSIGAETMVMKFQPDKPMHERYAVEHDFLSPDAGARGGDDRQAGQRVLQMGVQFLRDPGQAAARSTPIDYANACPDVALTSLHYYFPWAMKALVKWTVFALVTDRQAKLDLETDRYFAVADEPGMSYGEKLGEYRKLADAYFDTDRYQDFCATSWPAWTSWCWTGWPGPTSTGCWSAPSRRCTRPTSTTSSSPTCAGCCTCGSGTRARGWIPRETGTKLAQRQIHLVERSLKWAVTSRPSRSAARTGAGTGTR